MQFDGALGMNNDSMTRIYYSLQWFRTAELYLHLCGSMITENHMCPILQTACADKGKVYREVESLTLAVKSTAGKDGVRQTERGRMRK